MVSPTAPASSRPAAPSGVGLRVATVVSYVVNPLVLPPLVYGLVLGHIGAPATDVAWGVGVATVFLALVPLAHVGWMWSRGDVASLEIRDRSKRTEPFLGVLAASGAALLVVAGTDRAGRALLLALLACHVVNTSLLFLVTAWWKISVHCASMAGAVGTLAFVRMHVPGALLSTTLTGGGVLGVGAALVPVLLWARVRNRAHTWAQALAGAALGLVAPYAELYLLGMGAGAS